jgi:hypothetical protein
MARPKKADTERRSEQTKERWTVSELEDVNHRAAQVGLPRAEFIRLCALTQPLPEGRGKANPELAHALSRIGNNVNQLAKSVHLDTGFQQYWHEIGEELRLVLSAVLDEFSA